MKKDGIAAAGSFYFQLASQQSSLTSYVNDTPAITSINDLFDDNKDILASMSPSELGYYDAFDNKKELNRFSPTILVVAKEGKENLNEALFFVDINDEGKPTSFADGKGKNRKDSPFEKMGEEFDKAGLVNILNDGFRSYEMDNGKDNVNNVHPLVAIHEFGTNLLAGISIFVGAIIAIFGLTGIFSSVTTMAVMLSGLFTGLITAMFVPAIMMAFYIPMIPFILWMGTIFGWVVLIVQALFGAPLWLVTFLTPDNDGFVGRRGQGYMLIFSLTLRPVLMILGLISSFILAVPILRMINDFYGLAHASFENTTENGFLTFLFGKVAFLVIYVILTNKTVLQVFGLIHKMADELLSWIGGSGPQLGSYAQSVESGVSSGSVAAMAAGNALNNSLIGGSQQHANNLKNKQNNVGRDVDNLMKTNPDLERINDNIKNLEAEKSQIMKDKDQMVREGGASREDVDKQFEAPLAEIDGNLESQRNEGNLIKTGIIKEAMKNNGVSRGNLWGHAGLTGDAKDFVSQSMDSQGNISLKKINELQKQLEEKQEGFNEKGFGLKMGNDGKIENSQNLRSFGRTGTETGQNNGGNFANRANTVKVADDVNAQDFSKTNHEQNNLNSSEIKDNPYQNNASSSGSYENNENQKVKQQTQGQSLDNDVSSQPQNGNKSFVNENKITGTQNQKMNNSVEKPNPFSALNNKDEK